MVYPCGFSENMGDPTGSTELSIRNILIFVLYSAVLIIMFVLLAKRQIKRMRLRYDKNFHTEQVRSFPKYYGQELQGRIERAIQPKHNPILIKPRIGVKSLISLKIVL